MFFPIGEVPEEIKQQIERYMELQQMSGEERIASQTEFMERLSPSDLTIVRAFVRAAVRDSEYGNYLDGWMSHILQSKHRICQFCNQVHETVEDMLRAHDTEGR